MCFSFARAGLYAIPDPSQVKRQQVAGSMRADPDLASRLSIELSEPIRGYVT